MISGTDRRKLVTTVQDTADMERTGGKKKKGLGTFPLHSHFCSFTDDFHMGTSILFSSPCIPVQPVSIGQDMRFSNMIANMT